jgi:hypothetical protein
MLRVGWGARQAVFDDAEKVVRVLPQAFGAAGVRQADEEWQPMAKDGFEEKTLHTSHVEMNKHDATLSRIKHDYSRCPLFFFKNDPKVLVETTESVYAETNTAFAAEVLPKRYLYKNETQSAATVEKLQMGKPGHVNQRPDILTTGCTRRS